MLQTLLTLMLFIMPFLVSQKDISRPGLHAGLWVSLFFWGRLHPLFSLLVFGISLFYYGFCAYSLDCSPAGTVISPHRPGTAPLFGFLIVMVGFCAFGNICRDYGISSGLDDMIQKTAAILGFLGCLIGPILFGMLSDKIGPYPAFMILIFLGLIASTLTGLSPDFPYCFPFGSLVMQAVIGGVFALTPLLVMQFYGKAHLSHILPLLLLLLTGFWAAALRFYDRGDVLPQDCLLSMVFLLLMAIPLVTKAWHRRLVVL